MATEAGFELPDGNKGYVIDGIAEPLPYRQDEIEEAATTVVEELANFVTLQQEHASNDAGAVDALQVSTWRTGSQSQEGYALAMHQDEAVFLRVNVDPNAEPRILKRAVVELPDLSEATRQKSAQVLADGHTLEEVEILRELVKKQVKQTAEAAQEDGSVNLKNDPEIITALLLETEEQKRKEEQLASMLAETQSTVYESRVELERAARLALRKYAGRLVGSVTLALELHEAGTHSYVEIEGYRSKRRDHEVANMRFVYRGEGKPEAINLSDTKGAEDLHPELLGEFEKDSSHALHLLENGEPISEDRPFDYFWNRSTKKQ